MIFASVCLFAQESSSSSEQNSAVLNSSGDETSATTDSTSELASTGTENGVTKKKYGEDFTKIPTGNDYLLSLSAAWMMMAPGYTSAVMKNLPFYLDPSFRQNFQIGLGRFCSLDLFYDYNFMGLLRGGQFFIEWAKKCNTWVGGDEVASIIINCLLGGVPYLIGIVPSIYFAMASLDLGIYFYYHPYHNDWLDLKVGAGLTNEPSNVFDHTGYSFFLLPLVSTRAEANFIFGTFKIIVWTSFGWDMLTTIAYKTNQSLWSNDGISFTKLSGGVSMGFFIPSGSKKAKAEATTAKKAAKKASKNAQSDVKI